MRNDVLERKIARIIVALAEERGISEEDALDLFYMTETYQHLVDPETGLRLMSDGYILEEVRERLTGGNGSSSLTASSALLTRKKISYGSTARKGDSQGFMSV